MSNASLTRPMQEYGVGDPRQLSLTQYANYVRGVFDFMLGMDQHTMVHTITSGKSHQFMNIGNARARGHKAGTYITGSKKPVSEERIVSLDNEEVISPLEESIVDQNIRHFEVWSIWGQKQAQAVYEVYEARKIAMAARGARIDARVDPEDGTNAFPSGVLVRRNAADVATAYPVSQQGSRRFQQDLEQMQQMFSERNVPLNKRAILTTPYMHRVLLQDRDLASQNLGGLSQGNNFINYSVIKAAGFDIIASPFAAQIFGSDFTEPDEPQYDIDMNRTAALAMTTDDALGMVRFGGLSVDAPEWDKKTRVFWSNASHFAGIKWLRPEGLGEIYVDTTDYGATTDGKYPAFAPA